MTDKKRSKITDEIRAEAAALFAIWDRKATLSQADFGAAYDLGKQSNVGHYLRARNPLNLKAAAAFAHHLRCDIADFSPRLAAELLITNSSSSRTKLGLPDDGSVNAYSDTTLVRAPVLVWARLGDDVLKDPQELGGADLLDYVPIGAPSKRAKLIPVIDDALAPRLIVGDLVAIDPDNRQPARGQVTLFKSRIDGQYFLRRYQPLGPPHFEAVDAKGSILDSLRHDLEIVGVRCGMRPADL